MTTQRMECPRTSHQPFIEFFCIINDGMLQTLNEDHQSREDVNNTEYLCSDDPQCTLHMDQGWITVGTGKKGLALLVYAYYCS